MIKFKNWLLMFVITLIVWVLLSNSLAMENILPGIIIALLIGILFCRQCQVFSEINLTPKAFLYTFLYLGVFFIDLVKSNLDVARRVLTPSLPINPGIVEVKTSLKSKFGRMLLANSITLTPGTLTVEVSDDSFFIHWIDVKDDTVEAASNEIVKKFEKYLEVIYG
jgi:multicomponent Na+:H+ antiporter subunit E